jgi:hypothetical protein
MARANHVFKVSGFGCQMSTFKLIAYVAGEKYLVKIGLFEQGQERR